MPLHNKRHITQEPLNHMEVLHQNFGSDWVQNYISPLRYALCSVAYRFAEDYALFGNVVYTFPVPFKVVRAHINEDGSAEYPLWVSFIDQIIPLFTIREIADYLYMAFCDCYLDNPTDYLDFLKINNFEVLWPTGLHFPALSKYLHPGSFFDYGH